MWAVLKGITKWAVDWKTGKKEQILILLLLGVLLLVIAIPTGEEEANTDSRAAETVTVSEAQVMLTEVERLENRLQLILSHVAGIGKTEVMITLKSDGLKVVEKDLESSSDTEESTQDGTIVSGGVVSEKESTVYEKDAQGNEIPFVTEELTPEIDGVLVIAQGAGNSSAVAEITEAVMALFGVDAHKIKVMKME